MGEEVFLGTASSGSATTLVDSSSDSVLPSADDYWINWWFYIHTGANADVERQATDYVESTKTLTFGHAYPAAVASTSEYELVQNWRPRLINDIIDNTIRRCRHRIREWANATVTSSANIYEYNFSLSTGDAPFLLEMEEDTSHATYPYTEILRWKYTDAAGTYRIQMLDPDDLIVSRTLRLWYATDPSTLSADSSTSNIPEDIMYAGIRAEMYQRAADQQSDDQAFRRKYTLAQDWEGRFQRLLAEHKTRMPAKVARTLKWDLHPTGGTTSKRERELLRQLGE